VERLDVQIAVIHGEVPDEAVAYAEEKVREVAAYAPAPVRFARLALAEETNPSITRRAVAKATLDVDGQPVRAHIAAEEFNEAADLLTDRLRRGLDTLAEQRQERWRDTGESGEGQWRHGDIPTDRPEYFPRPPEDREIVRRKTYALREMAPDEAAVELDLLDLDWLLFTELDTGADALLQRDGETYRLLIAAEDPPATTEHWAIPVEVDASMTTMRTSEATDALDVGQLPFVFFVDAVTGRGTVMYRRYDGHYGIIEPADSEDERAGAT
jgi:ribosome-associated translation inhibitor RaiA